MNLPTPTLHWPRRLRPARRDRGAVIPLVALMLTTLMLGTAFSIDLGRVRAVRRDLQADADFLALDAASVLDGLTADEALPLVVNEANASAVRNQYDFEPVTSEHVELGIWDNNTFTPVTGSTVPNAVRITLTDSVPMYFDLSTDERSVTRWAIGVDDFPELCLPFPCTPPPGGMLPASRAEVGSVLARLDTYQQPEVDPAFNEAVELQATFMNHIYTQFLGVNVAGGVDFGAGVTGDPDPVTGPATGLRLDAVSYKGLADALVSIDQIAEELAAQGHLGTGTVEELMAANVGVADFLQAAATVLSNGPTAADVSASTILGDIATAMDQTLTMQFGRYLQASTGRAGALETFVNADDLLLATISIINGRNFADVTIPSGDDLEALGVPPTLLARVTVIEPPQWHQGLRHAGEYGPSTSQIKVEVNVPVSALDIDVSPLGLPFGLVTRAGNIPLVMEVAKAESFYSDMACRTDTTPSWTDLRVENSGVEIGFDSDSVGIVETAGTLPTTAMVQGSLNVLALTVDLEAMTDIGHAVTWSQGAQYAGTLSSNAALLENFDTRRHFPPYQSEWLQYPSAPGPSASVDETFGSVDFNSSGLSSGMDALLSAAIINAFDPVMSQLNAALADPLLQSMGVTLAGSDARVQQLLCETVFLS